VDAALQVDPPGDGPTSWFRDITDPTDGPRARIDYLFLYAEDAERALTVKRCFMIFPNYIVERKKVFQNDRQTLRIKELRCG